MKFLAIYFKVLIFSYFSIKRKVLINYYSKEAERGILYNDPNFKIDWILPEQNLLISDKDKANSPLKEAFALLNEKKNINFELTKTFFG